MNDLSSYGSEFYEIFRQLGKSYRQADCYDLCYQTFVLKKCNCIDTSFYSLPNKTFCLDVKDLICDLSSFLEFFSNNNWKSECGNNCPLECESQNFQLTVSTSVFPSKAYANQLINHSTLLNRYYGNATSQVTLDQLKNNLLAVDIYYSDMKYTSIEEIEKTSFLDLVAGVGGTLGLFIGMSFLSFFEIIDVLLEIGYVFAKKFVQTSLNNSIKPSHRVVSVKPAHGQFA